MFNVCVCCFFSVDVNGVGFPAAAAAAYAAYGRGLAAYPGIGFPYPAGNVSSSPHHMPVILPFEQLHRVFNMHAMPL